MLKDDRLLRRNLVRLVFMASLKSVIGFIVEMGTFQYSVKNRTNKFYKYGSSLPQIYPKPERQTN